VKIAVAAPIRDQGQERHECEGRAAFERAGGKAGLSGKRVTGIHALSPFVHREVDVAGVAPVPGQVAEQGTCLAFGIRACQSVGAHELLDAFLQMKSEFLVDVRFEPGARWRQPKHPAQPAPEALLVVAHAHLAGSVCSSSATTSAYRSQRDCSTANCLRPAAVRR
jgi:hypothetical protein